MEHVWDVAGSRHEQLLFRTKHASFDVGPLTKAVSEKVVPKKLLTRPGQNWTSVWVQWRVQHQVLPNIDRDDFLLAQEKWLGHFFVFPCGHLRFVAHA